MPEPSYPLGEPIRPPPAPPNPRPVDPAGRFVQEPDGKWQTNIPTPPGA